MMNSSRESERNSLTTLTLQSDAAIKELQKKNEKVTKRIAIYQVVNTVFLYMYMFLLNV